MTGSERSRLHPPSDVRVASRRHQEAVVVERDPPLGVEAVPLAGHRHVLGPAQPQPNRASGEGGPERGDGGQAVGLHLLAPEAAPHPQALHGDRVARPAEHVRDDLLGLARVLGAALHEDLPALVDVRDRAVGLEVEVLLARALGHAAVDVGRVRERAVDVAALQPGHPALEAARLDRLEHGDQGRQRLVVHLDGQRPEPRGLERLAEHPADRLPVEHHLGGEERLVALDAGVVDPGHVLRGEHAHDAGHGEGGADVEAASRGRGRAVPAPDGRAAGPASARRGRRCRARHR